MYYETNKTLKGFKMLHEINLMITNSVAKAAALTLQNNYAHSQEHNQTVDIPHQVVKQWLDMFPEHSIKSFYTERMAPWIVWSMKNHELI